jgi:hypothetical protein
MAEKKNRQGKAGTAPWPGRAEAIAGLESLLQSGDYSSGQFFRDIAAELKAAFGEDIDGLEQLIAVYDYPRALAALAALRKAHPELDAGGDA